MATLGRAKEPRHHADRNEDQTNNHENAPCVFVGFVMPQFFVCAYFYDSALAEGGSLLTGDTRICPFFRDTIFGYLGGFPSDDLGGREAHLHHEFLETRGD